MVKYRLYIMEGDQTSGPPVLIECRDETDAIEKAKRLLNTRDIEVRRRGRLVVRLRPVDK